VQEKKRKQRALFRAAERERPLPLGSRKRPEEMEVETRSRTRRSIVRRHSLSGQRFAAVYSTLSTRLRGAFRRIAASAEDVPPLLNSER